VTTLLPLLLGALAIAMPLVLGQGAAILGLGTVLGGGALLASGTRAGVVAGLVAILAALTLPAGAYATVPMVIGVAAGALGVGLLWRVLDEALPHLLTEGSGFAAFWLIALGAIAMALPDGWVRAYASDGAPLALEAVAKDAATGLRTPMSFPGFLPHESPAAPLTAVFPYLAALVAFGVLAPLREQRWRQLAWWAALGLGAVLAFVGLAGLLEQLMGEAIVVGSAEELSSALNRASGGTVAVELATVPRDAFLGLDSRPAVDTMRLIPGGLLVLLATLQLRGRRVGEGVALAASSQPLVLVAAMAAIGAATMTEQGQQLVLAGVVVLLLGSLLAAQFGHVSRRAPYAAVLVALSLSIYAWAGPVAGWLTG